VTAAVLPLKKGLPAWITIALESFGGPVAQIVVLHRVIVTERRWVSEAQFQRALSFCMLLPGPEAQQLATYLGWLLHGPRGALVAGALFVLPGFIVLLALSWLYVTLGDTSVAQGVLNGIKPAVVAIIAHALWRMARRLMNGSTRLLIALGAFAALFFFQVPFPIVVLVGGIAGAWLLPRAAVDLAPSIQAPERRTTLASGIAWLVLWLLPLLIAALTLGRNHVLVEEGRFFATSALVTFGGAYAVLTYVAQEAVHRFGWLTADEMVTGLGFAESTPGPLIQVVQFVAFLAAYRAPAPLEPITAAILASLLVTWVTFVPSFFFILGFGPLVERVAHNKRLLGALDGVAAGVFGAMLNLALWFALHSLFGEVRDITTGALHLTVPRLASIDWLAVAFAAVGVVVLVRTKIAHLWILAAAVVFGIVRQATR
jgi:chromate transporter